MLRLSGPCRVGADTWPLTGPPNSEPTLWHAHGSAQGTCGPTGRVREQTLSASLPAFRTKYRFNLSSIFRRSMLGIECSGESFLSGTLCYWDRLNFELGIAHLVSSFRFT